MAARTSRPAALAPVGPARPQPTYARSFTAIGTTNRIVTTDPTSIVPAYARAVAYLDDLDRVASRFRTDSEISRLTERARTTDLTVPISPLLADVLSAVLTAARLTAGLVDPTVGAAVATLGYDDDIDVVRARRDTPASVPARVPGWRTVRLDRSTGRPVLTIERGTVLDVGSVGKAYAADALANDLAARLPGGFLVDLGGDIAVGGTLPDDGWAIGVEDPTGALCQVVVSHGQAVTTSSTRKRRWFQDGVERHHIVDPRTGQNASVHWAQVTCAAATAVEANAASTAAIILGEHAPGWLSGHGIPARLAPNPDLTDDSRPVFTSGWAAA